jgi:hypothetical protein
VAGIAKESGDTEVHEFADSGCGHEDIRRFEIAVDNSAGVRSVERSGELLDHLDTRCRVDRREELAKRRPFHVFHDEQAVVRVISEFVQHDEAGVFERGHRVCFLTESSECNPVGCVEVHLFDGDEAAFRPPGEVNGTACPTSQHAEEPEIGPVRRRATRSRCEHSLSLVLSLCYVQLVGRTTPLERGSSHPIESPSGRGYSA